jgi:hypothetical protein
MVDKGRGEGTVALSLYILILASTSLVSGGHLSKRQKREQYLAPLSRHEYNFLLNMKEAKLEQNRLSNQRSSKNVTEILTNNMATTIHMEETW